MRVRNKAKEMEYTERWRRNKPISALFSQLKGNVRTRKLEVTISLEDLEKLVAPMRCSVTGVPLSWVWTGEGNNPWAPSVDRLDCSKGYVPGNVRLVCWAYNIARRNWPDEVVLTWALALTGRRSCE